ncbi:DoxX family protein [Propionicicella superfundia]|uniref:DoxX family protein n=1 Tax=Propionicicella superfundia TaxID=348582 RepID=UPI0003FF4431|nr:DoxX family protein [Propionicicella superfundia]
MGIGIIARPLLASVFVSGGYNQVTQPGGRVKAVQQTLDKVPMDLGENGAEYLVKANGAIMAGAGATLALGVLPRLSAAALIASLIPTTLIGHPFWTMDDPKARSINQSQVLKNLGLIGGLLLVAATGKKQKTPKAPKQKSPKKK